MRIAAAAFRTFRKASFAVSMLRSGIVCLGRKFRWRRKRIDSFSSYSSFIYRFFHLISIFFHFFLYISHFLFIRIFFFLEGGKVYVASHGFKNTPRRYEASERVNMSPNYSINNLKSILNQDWLLSKFFETDILTLAW